MGYGGRTKPHHHELCSKCNGYLQAVHYTKVYSARQHYYVLGKYCFECKILFINDKTIKIKQL